MAKTTDLFPLQLGTMREMPNALCLGEDLVLIDNSDTPHFTNTSNKWQGVPSQTEIIITVFCTEGEMNVRIALHEYTLRKNCVCVLIPGTIIEVLGVTPNFHCITMAMSKEFIAISQSHISEPIKLVKYLRNSSCTQLTGMYASRYHDIMVDAIRTMKWHENPMCTSMMQTYVYLLFCCHYPMMLHEDDKHQDSRKPSHQREIYISFMEMLQSKYRQERSVAYYAEQLGITPKYLSKVINEESGRPALRWIEDFVILEAKALLRQHNTNVQMVAQRLNFTDQSTFGKFFRRIVGVSPREYRGK